MLLTCCRSRALPKADFRQSVQSWGRLGVNPAAGSSRLNLVLVL